MKLKEIMTPNVEVIHPDDSLQIAARKMRDNDIGILPVCDGDRLIGIISDRDLAIRGLAEGKDATTMIGRDLMTSPVMCCDEDQDVTEAAQIMQENQIRRLIVLNSSKRMVGVVSLGDLAVNDNSDHLSGKVLQSVSEPVAVK
ncbi:MAG: CBS domain-containing protein [Anaerolineales bacterium]|nr:CBS domain-containing protein [Anaerolineales bacterium]